MVLKDEKVSLLPVIFTAALPQFAFISGAINNDNPVNLFSTISIYFLIKIFTKPDNLKNYALAGLAIGLGIITKKTIYFIFPVSIITIIIIGFSKYTINKNKILAGIIIAALAAALISSLYIIHNITSYREIVGLKEEYSTFAKFDSHSLLSYYFIDPFSHEFFKSFIGYPGLMNVLLPKIIYAFYAVLFITGFLFLIIKLKKVINDNRAAIVLFISVLSCLAGIIYFNTLLSQFQGRFLFPVISAVAILLTIGLKEFTNLFKRFGHKSYLAYGLIFAFIIADIISIIVTYKFYFTPSQYGL